MPQIINRVGVTEETDEGGDEGAPNPTPEAIETKSADEGEDKAKKDK